jgi:hypothetical protein
VKSRKRADFAPVQAPGGENCLRLTGNAPVSAQFSAQGNLGIGCAESKGNGTTFRTTKSRIAFRLANQGPGKKAHQSLTFLRWAFGLASCWIELLLVIRASGRQLLLFAKP